MAQVICARKGVHLRDSRAPLLLGCALLRLLEAGLERLARFAAREEDGASADRPWVGVASRTEGGL
eukprot:10854325-Alexandrium_andersonii.AAC.1